MNHDEIPEDAWQNQTDEWIEYVKNGIFCTVFGYARYS